VKRARVGIHAAVVWQARYAVPIVGWAHHVSRCCGTLSAMPSNMGSGPVDSALHRHFSPWLAVQRACSTCTHAVGMDGAHFWCQRHQIVVVMPCGCWEREPGCD